MNPAKAKRSPDPFISVIFQRESYLIIEGRPPLPAGIQSGPSRPKGQNLYQYLS